VHLGSAERRLCGVGPKLGTASDVMIKDMSELADLIASKHSIVFFGGAGVSTESGIPDFRSATGLYTTLSGGKYSPEYMLSRSCYRDHREEFWEFYRAHLLYPDAQPNAAHLALAKLEEQRKLTAVVTQNVDGLHQAAGSKNVVELHGSAHRNLCEDCNRTYGLDFILETTGVPSCPKCGGPVRPDVVLYEEGLDWHVIEFATTAITHADMLIVGGTSLNVYPAAGLVQYYHGDALVLINKDPTPADRMANLVIHDSLGKVLSEAVGL
jgi:NAD-dependent deacetylase